MHLRMGLVVRGRKVARREAPRFSTRFELPEQYSREVEEVLGLVPSLLVSGRWTE